MHDELVGVYISKEKDRHGAVRYRVTTVRRGDAGRSRTSRTFTAESTARRHRDAVLAEAKAKRDLTVGELFEEYVEEHGREIQAQSTRRMRDFLAGFGDHDFPAASVTPELALEWYRAHQEDRAAATHRAALARVKLAWTWALEEGRVTSNPWRRVRPEGTPNTGKEQLRLDEARTFTAHCLRVRGDLALAALLALFLGLRRSEIIGLTARDADDGGRLLWVAAKGGKTKNAKRTVRVPAVLAEFLAEAVAGKEPDAPIISVPGARLNVGIPALCKAAGVPRVTPHGLRGTQSSLARQAGATPEMVAATLGHASTAVTERSYIQPHVTASERAAQAWHLAFPTETPRKTATE